MSSFPETTIDLVSKPSSTYCFIDSFLIEHQVNVKERLKMLKILDFENSQHTQFADQRNL